MYKTHKKSLESLQHFSNFEMNFWYHDQLSTSRPSYISKSCFNFEIEAGFQWF